MFRIPIDSFRSRLWPVLTATVASGNRPRHRLRPHDVFLMHGPRPGGDMMRGEFGEGKTVTGAPLSGDFVVTRDTTLADGNRIHNESQSKVYRDSRGPGAARDRAWTWRLRRPAA